MRRARLVSGHSGTVANTRDGSLTPGMTHIINGRKIQKITSSTVKVCGTAQQIDAPGKCVVPGFLDMHTHSGIMLSDVAAAYDRQSIQAFHTVMDPTHVD
ncbi:MAG: hypothetical protein ABI537_06045 [Casimicrobiaceae bacterium]